MDQHADLHKYLLHSVEMTGVKLGTGSFGSVEEVTMAGTVCAGKIWHETLLDPKNEGVDNMVQRFVHECELMSHVHHPNIVQFMGICFKEGSPYPMLVMERMLMSLDGLLETRNDLPLGLKLQVLLDVTRGLVHLHNNMQPPIVHRDLTTRNVLLTESLVAKIADLGNARMIKPGKLSKTLSDCPGTLVYMPPETGGDKPSYSSSMDIFSFGHLALYTVTQVFPSNLLPATYTDLVSYRLFPRSELERRRQYINILHAKIGEGHALTGMIEQCLSNVPDLRPTAAVLLNHIEGLTKTKKYRDEFDAIQGKTKLVLLDEMLDQIQVGVPDLLQINTVIGPALRKQRGFKEYVFMVTDTVLKYRKLNKDKDTNSIPLSSITSVNAVKSSRFTDTSMFYFEIYFTGNGSPWLLRTHTKNKCMSWVKSLVSKAPNLVTESTHATGQCDPACDSPSSPAAPITKRELPEIPSDDSKKDSPDGKKYPSTRPENEPPSVVTEKSQAGDKDYVNAASIAQDTQKSPVYENEVGIHYQPSDNESGVNKQPDIQGTNSSAEEATDGDEGGTLSATSGVVATEVIYEKIGIRPSRVFSATLTRPSPKHDRTRRMSLTDLERKQLQQKQEQQQQQQDVSSEQLFILMQRMQEIQRMQEMQQFMLMQLQSTHPSSSQLSPATSPGAFPHLELQFHLPSPAPPPPPPKTKRLSIPDMASERPGKESRAGRKSEVTPVAKTGDSTKYGVTMETSKQKMEEVLRELMRSTGYNKRLITGGVPELTSTKNEVDFSDITSLFISKKDISQKKLLKSGNFGNVYYAKLHKGEKEIEVAIKMIKSLEDPRDKLDFEREQSIMQQMAHPNIVRLYGLLHDEDPPSMVLEYMPNGDLKTFLKENKRPVSKLTKYMLDVSMGMDYISKMGLVHRDLAARNVMLDKDEICKVGDFGLLRQMKGAKKNDVIYYVSASDTPIPIRWMAPESLDVTKKHFSTASDVWSFGIVQWEMMNPEENPYKDNSNEEVRQLVIFNDLRLPIPSEYPPDIQSVMKACWNKDPSKRLSFFQISYVLTKLIFGC